MSRGASGTAGRASRRAATAGLAAALLLAAGAASAQAFTRTTTCDSNPAAGNALWWGGSPPAVTWWLYAGSAPAGAWAVNPTGLPAGCADVASLESLVAASFSAWSGRASPTTGAVSGFAFQHASPTNRTTSPAFGNDGRNLVAFRHGLCKAIPASDPCHAASTCQDTYNCWDETGTSDPNGDVLALTWVTFRDSGQILDADMELNDWNGLSTATGGTPAGFSFTCFTPAPLNTSACAGCQSGDADKGGCTAAAARNCVWADVGAIVTHESGHVLGLDHPASGCPSTCGETMAPRIPLGTSDKRVLSTEDLKGVTTIYPGAGAAAQQALGACPGSASGTTPTSRSCGCGGDPSAALWALLGPALLWRRRRR